MAFETPPVPDTRPGLPPVQAPSGRLLGQLFLVPGLIVAGVVVILLFFNWLVSGPRSAESFLRKLDDLNPEVRWRAAADLSQVLLRDDRLAADPSFALALASRLRSEVADQQADLPRSLSREADSREQAKREQERNYVNFLEACLGNFLVPVGAPLLQELAVADSGLPPRFLAERRRHALWALAQLGENLKRFDKLPSPDQQAILTALGAPRTDSSQTAWAETARRHLQARLQGTPDALSMDATIATCAQAQEPFLRELAAFVANFWKGSPAAESRIEETLVRLSHDDGHGEELLEEWAREEAANKEPTFNPAITKVPGLKVRMNAAAALARRGSSRARPAVLAEMLDESSLGKAFVLREPNGQEKPDEATVVEIVAATLKAVAELHRQRPDLAMPEVRAAVDRLASNENPALAVEAKNTRLALEK